MIGRCDDHVGEQFVRRCDACEALAGSKGRVEVPEPEWARPSTPPNSWAGLDA